MSGAQRLLIVFGIVSYISIASGKQAIFCSNDEPEKHVLTWSGTITTESWFDTRQNKTKRSGNELLFPEKKSIDPRGYDITDHGKFGIIPFMARLGVAVDGPQLFCSEKTAINISGDFRGLNDEISPVLRLYKAYIKFEYPDKDILVGQTNHVLHSENCLPNTVAYGKGTPFDTIARVPQVRLTWRPFFFTKNQSDEIIFMLYSHSRTTQSRGPTSSTNDAPISSDAFIQNARMPGLSIQVCKKYENISWGFGCDAKRITPRLESSLHYKDTESLMSGLIYGYCVYRDTVLTLKSKIVYMYDGTEFGFISGYGVKSECPITRKRTYTNLRSLSYWVDGDCAPEDSCLSFGFFTGIAYNKGSHYKLFRNNQQNHIVFTGISGSYEIIKIARFAPRIRYHCGPLTFGAEIDWTRAEYGLPNDCGKPRVNISNKNYGPVNNIRFLLNSNYIF